MSTATLVSSRRMRYPLNMAVAAVLLIFVLGCIIKLALS
ncbi:hypothetical protein BCh11DRAFT_02595 [Burkholderia sp. Ch1-1]|nr:hypothetical protein BCh11DRAFT_02595 [Burkholderia sp. Ch1-1]